MPIIRKMTKEMHKKVAKNLLKLKFELMDLVRIYENTHQMYDNLYGLLSAIEDARYSFCEQLVKDHQIRKRDDRERAILDKIYYPKRPK